MSFNYGLTDNLTLGIVEVLHLKLLTLCKTKVNKSGKG